MTEEEKKWFKELRKDREENARVMRKRSMNGVKKDVIEKYPDTAHFIYELLQNADDTGATKVKFMLEKDRLIFKHNGTRRFSISDPNDENNTLQLGDINSITSIGNSTKQEEQNTIGKFGVGFKSVFQYTSTPEIYDRDFCFRIEELVVPVLIDEDYNGREKDETLFVFPFNSEKMTKEEAYQDISNKLQSLSYPSMFLNNIKDIDYEFKDKENLGMYEKRIIESKILDENTTAEFIEYTQGKIVKLNDIAKQKKLKFESIESQKEFSESGDILTERFWKFNRKIPTSNDLICSIAFLVDEKNNQLKPIKKTAFCFFPTREDTKLNFLINAPFLLNNSRANIVTKELHNKKMIEILSQLAGDSLVYLRDIDEEKSIRYIDDNILDIVPLSESAFYCNENEQISFLPFYTQMRNKFKTEKLLPTKNGNYVTKENAYWTRLNFKEFLSNEQLSVLFNNDSAEWVFYSVSENERSEYIRPLVNKYITDDDFLNSCTPNFIENQSIEWLQNLYLWILDGKERRNKAKIKPIFLNQDKKAVTVLQDGKLNLFFPSNTIISTGYNIVYKELLDNPDTKKLLEFLGVRVPNTEDYLKNIVLKQCEDNDPNINYDNLFINLFYIYKKNKSNQVLWDFRDKSIWKYYTFDENKNVISGYEKGLELYFPTNELKAYFETKPSTKFLDIRYYKSILSKNSIAYDEDELQKFFIDRFRVKDFPSVISAELVIEKIDNAEIEFQNFTGAGDTINIPNNWIKKKGLSLYEYYLEGFPELLYSIYTYYESDIEKAKKKSVLLWKFLLKIVEKALNEKRFIDYGYMEEYFFTECKYYKYSNPSKLSSKKYDFSGLANDIYNCSWLFTKKDEEPQPTYEIYLDELSDIYELNKTYKFQLDYMCKFIQLSQRKVISKEEKYDLMIEKAKKYGFDSPEAFFEDYEKKKALERLQREENRNQISSDEYVSNIDHLPTRLSQPKDISDSSKETEKNLEADNSEELLENKPKDVESSVDKEINSKLKDKIKEIRDRAEDEIKKLREGQLESEISNAPKYSFSWFKYLLKKEKDLITGGKDSKNKEFTLIFYKVSRDKDSNQILILENPNRYIPQDIEEFGNIPLTLVSKDNSKDVEIEVCNAINNTLRVKLKANSNIDDVDFESIQEAKIVIKEPDFLIESLCKEFESLNFADDYDLQKNLCENIEFVFGPPGTGKTTHLARKFLLPKMNTEDVKILVLTPTNKSADVLTNKIIQNDKEEEYKNFLVRFGKINDETISQNEVFYEKIFDIEKAKKNITITTMARFPYDFFMVRENRNPTYLREIEWDYIVIDEASMIPLAYIVYVLYKAKPKQFIIAGDPFQIDPIVQCKEWKEENIYDLVNLKSFKYTKTVPHEYEVHQLPIQYRSIPSIGNIFSKFTYDGILNHERKESDQLKLNIEDKINIKSLNIIKYPVSKYESIYRPKRLGNSSPYQIYSALFSFEFAQYLANIISERNPNKNIKIGVISPYKAQVDIIDRLLSSADIPQNISIQAGTIHGFQGDECNIIITVLNTPTLSDKSKIDEIFLNKNNIINVSISRARDYLFVIMPDDNTDKLEKLALVRKLENLIKENDYAEFSSKEVEKLMFGSETYLEENAFSTGHQNVNVYNLPQKCYEIRSGDYSIDIQVHKEK